MSHIEMVRLHTVENTERHPPSLTLNIIIQHFSKMDGSQEG